MAKQITGWFFKCVKITNQKSLRRHAKRLIFPPGKLDAEDKKELDRMIKQADLKLPVYDALEYLGDFKRIPKGARKKKIPIIGIYDGYTLNTLDFVSYVKGNFAYVDQEEYTTAG